MAINFDNQRNEFMEKFRKMLGNEYDVLLTNSNELCVPIVNDDGDEGFLVVTFKIPKGTHDGELYDGYEVASDFEKKQKEREEKRIKAEEKKKQAIAKDKQRREAQEKIRQEKQARETK